MVGYTIFENDQHNIFTRTLVGTLPEIVKGKYDTEQENFLTLLKEIQNSLNDNVAPVAGVFKKAKINDSTSNNNHASHHFIVITGMKLNGNVGQLYYHEVGVISEDFGKDQVLNIDISKLIISGRNKYYETRRQKVLEDPDYPLYILTEIRVKPKYRNTKTK